MTTFYFALIFIAQIVVIVYYALYPVTEYKHFLQSVFPTKKHLALVNGIIEQILRNKMKSLFKIFKPIFVKIICLKEQLVGLWFITLKSVFMMVGDHPCTTLF
jgi:hypothetical protein